MKAKTIKAVLAKKMVEWMESVDDDVVREIIAKNTIITGGSIASMLLREPVNDYDVYFRTQSACRAVAEYYVGRFNRNPPKTFADGSKEVHIYVDEKEIEKSGRVKIVVRSAGIAGEGEAVNYRYFEGDPDAEAYRASEYIDKAMESTEEMEDEDKPKFRPVFLTTNAITLSQKVQIVTRFYGEPDEIHANYDFEHCMSYWTSWNKELVLRPAAMEALLARELRYVGSKYPLCSIIRTRKFITRGWCINAGQYLKMAMQLNDLNLTDLDVLEDQLIGVDTAYFVEIIEKLKARDKTRVDSAYLLEIIDRIF